MGRKIRFGIMGPGIISHRFVLGTRFVEDCELFAVASRDLLKAQEYAAKYKIPHAYGGYRELLEDERVEVVYIATPTFMHFSQVMDCLKNGKHVLCEKPFMATSNEIREAFKYAKEHDLFLMEAMKAVFTPAMQQVQRFIETGMIGELKYLEASYCYKFSGNKNHWVYQQELAGGGMMDVGVYALAMVHMLANSPIVESKKMSMEADFSADMMSQILSKYQNGVMSSACGGIGFKTENKLCVYGTKGQIIAQDFWKTDSVLLKREGLEDLVIQYCSKSEFQYQIGHVVSCIQTGRIESPLMSEEASLKIMQSIETQ